MLFVVTGSSGLGDVAGVAPDDPTGLLPLLTDRPSSHVLVLAPAYAEIDAREQAHVAVAADPAVRVGVAALPHHPLTLTLLAAVLAEREGQPDGWQDPGEAVQLLRQLGASARSVLWHPRVLGLSHPQPSLVQRMSSVVRASGFFGDYGADGVFPAKDGPGAAPGETWYVAGEPPAVLAGQLEGTPYASVPVTVPGRRPYALRTTVELTALVLATRPLVPGARCPSCTARFDLDGCLYCGSDRRSPFEPRRAAARTVRPTPSSQESDAA